MMDSYPQKPISNHDSVAAAVIAGGKSTRMGEGDKFLMPLNGTPLLEHVLTRLEDQAVPILINSNSDLPTAYHPYPKITDSTIKHLDIRAQGPIAGLLSCMAWLHQNYPHIRYLLTLPADCPFIPEMLVTQLMEVMHHTDTEVVCAADHQQRHYLTAIWSVNVFPLLRDHVARGEFAIKRIQSHLKTTEVVFDNVVHKTRAKNISPFFNINTPEDFAIAQQFIHGG